MAKDLSFKSYAQDQPGKMHLFIRRIALALLKMTSTDIRIKHHYTGRRFHLNSYRHKGYWYYGKKRESATMKRFKDMIRPGMNILEIGGHIGYLTVYFSYLTGKDGHVTVFEPGKNNLGYLSRNISSSGSSNIKVEELAAGDANQDLPFYLDPLTGQNNSLVRNFEGFLRNRKLSAEPEAESGTDYVKVVKLDDYYMGRKAPDFVKVDIEGYEWECIRGFAKTIEAGRPMMMIEIQSNEKLLWDFFSSRGYNVYSDEMKPLNGFDEFSRYRTPNIFFIPRL